MGKNKKAAVQSKKQAVVRETSDNQASLNGTGKKDATPKASLSNKSKQPSVSTKKQQNQPKSQVHTKSPSSTKFWLIVFLLASSVAIVGVLFRKEIQKVAENVIEKYMSPDVLDPSHSDSDSEETHQSSRNIPSPDIDEIHQVPPVQDEVDSQETQETEETFPDDFEENVQEELEESSPDDIEDSLPDELEDSFSDNLEDSQQEEIDELAPDDTESSQLKELEDSFPNNVEDSKHEEVEDSSEGSVEHEELEDIVLDNVEENLHEELKQPDQFNRDGEVLNEPAPDSTQDRLRATPDSTGESLHVAPESTEDSLHEELKVSVPDHIKDSVHEELKASVPVRVEDDLLVEVKIPVTDNVEVGKLDESAPEHAKINISASHSHEVHTPKVDPEPSHRVKIEVYDAAGEQSQKAASQDSQDLEHGERQKTQEDKAESHEKVEKLGKPVNEEKLEGKDPEPSDKKADPTKDDHKELEKDIGIVSEVGDEALEGNKQSATEESSYDKMNITNQVDFDVRVELDEADDLLAKEELEKAVEKYDVILRKSVSSPRAYYGKGLVLDKLGFKYMSNEYLEKAIEYLFRVLQLPNVPDDLFKLAGRTVAERQQFRGWGGKSVKTFKILIERFPNDLNLKNEYGVSYMMIGQDDRARDVFQEVLTRDADNGFAKAHLGFIIKTKDNDLELAVKMLSEGVQSGAPGTEDGRFYLHLGDSLLRLGREQEARKFFQEGEDKGLFLSAWQRSLYNVAGLTGRPWWTMEQTGYQEYLKMLEDNWKTIRDEGLAQLNAKTASFMPEDENLRDTGDWKQFTLYQQGRKNEENCAKAPKTCAIIDKIPDARGCKRGQVKFSVMSPGIHVWPHVGPTNCRIRAHLGLIVPEGPLIRVKNETRTWKEGHFIIFDDSFEHEVWHEGSELRLVLIVDFWHPELNSAQKHRLPAI